MDHFVPLGIGGFKVDPASLASSTFSPTPWLSPIDGECFLHSIHIDWGFGNHAVEVVGPQFPATG